MDNIESILTSIKKPLGIPETDTSFDSDIIMHINSVFPKLRRLGVGPSGGFYIDDASKKWSDYVQDRNLAEAVKTFVYIKVKIVFDPPASPTVLEALKSSADEYACEIRDWMDEH